jgi:hypothetical protein
MRTSDIQINGARIGALRQKMGHLWLSLRYGFPRFPCKGLRIGAGMEVVQGSSPTLLCLQGSRLLEKTAFGTDEGVLGNHLIAVISERHEAGHEQATGKESE